MNVTQALSLEAIKGEAGATSREIGRNNTHTSLRHQHTCTTPLKKDLGSAPSLESL
jgi:hypothetical protein